MTPDILEYERRDSLAILRLNRPEVHNAVSLEMMERFEHHLDAIETDATVRVVILTGTGSRTFSAGGDLDDFTALASAEEGRAMSLRMQAILGRLAEGPRPVLAAINGDTWGGGCEILTACHLRLAAAEARFGFRQASLGLITGWGGGARLFHLVGRAAALRLLLSAETIPAVEALRLGLVDQVVPRAEVFAETLSLATHMATNSAASLAAFLALARAVERDDPEAVTRFETDTFTRLWTGEIFRQLLAKRAARRQERRGETHGP